MAPTVIINEFISDLLIKYLLTKYTRRNTTNKFTERHSRLDITLNSNILGSPGFTYLHNFRIIKASIPIVRAKTTPLKHTNT